MQAVVKVLAILSIAFLASCSLFSSDDDEVATTSQASPAQPAVVPVTAVRSIEVGRTRDGIIVTATGTAPGLGFSKPRLMPRRDGQVNRAGFLEFDFVVIPPDPNFELPSGSLSARAVRADQPVKASQLRAVRGIRVFGVSNGVQFIFTDG